MCEPVGVLVGAARVFANRAITFGCSRILVGHTHVRVMKLRRVLREVTSLQSFEVRPWKPSSTSIVNQKVKCTIDVQEDSCSQA
jgi:hypothetical protein